MGFKKPSMLLYIGLAIFLSTVTTNTANSQNFFKQRVIKNHERLLWYPAKDNIYSIWMRSDGQAGWAVGHNGYILNYKEGQWQNYSAKGKTPLNSLYGVWMNSDGTEGWAVGSVVILHYENEQWKQHSVPNLHWYLKALWMNSDGSEGWAVGNVVLHYENKEWQWYSAGYWWDLEALWMNSDGTEGWASNRSGLVVRYSAIAASALGATILPVQNAEWSRYDTNDIGPAIDPDADFSVPYFHPLILFQGTDLWRKRMINMNAVWMNTQGTDGWAVGDGGILHYEHEYFEQYLTIGRIIANWIEIEKDVRSLPFWDNHSPPQTIMEEPYYNLTAIWLKQDGSDGWILGDHGIILRYDSQQWRIYVEPKRLSADKLRAIWMNPEGSEGWAVGDGGTILHYQNSTFENHGWSSYAGGSTKPAELAKP